MKVSFNWLKELTGLDWSVEETEHRLTMCGTACEEVIAADRYMDRVVVGEVVELLPIEGASKIKLARVNVGNETLDSVCGAPNVATGQKVPTALIGARLAEGFEMKKTRIRGVESQAMICSERELGISQDHSGILVLDDDAPVGTPLVEYLDFHDYMLTFELTPNRADSMSAIGIARDIAALAGTTLRRPRIALRESSQKTAEYITVTTEDPHGCPRYAARVIRNIKVAPSPWWLKKKLLMSGVRPISNVVDITNLVMLETGHPLHAFDLDRFGSREVVVRRATSGEKFTTLDGCEHELTPEVLLITNGQVPVAAAGVMGGLESEVDDGTSELLLEAAYFNPSVIRKSRRRLGTVSESSMRFEKGADPNGIPFAIDRAAGLLQELCGGEVLQGMVDCYPEKIEPVRVDFRPGRCNRVLGTDISRERMKEIFTRLEFTVEDTDPLQVTVPTFRPDIGREIDLIEEVARIEGYDNIPDAVTNIGPLYAPRHELDVFLTDLRRTLTGVGFDEMLGHGLAESGLSRRVNPDEPQLRLVNSVSRELDIVRNSLIPAALSVIKHNVAHRNLDLRLFEVGKVYFPPDEQGNWREDLRLLLAVTGSTPDGWREQPRPLDFYDVTGGLERLVDHFRWPPFGFEPGDAACLDSAISFRVSSKGQTCGVAGRVASALLDKLDIDQPVYLAEIELECLSRDGRKSIRFVPLAQYPAAPRDLAILVAAGVRAGELVAAVIKAAGDLAESVRIFDVYSGEQIEKGLKSVAVNIVYRSRQGSLSSDQVDELQQKVVDSLKKMFNAEIRDK